MGVRVGLGEGSRSNLPLTLFFSAASLRSSMQRVDIVEFWLGFSYPLGSSDTLFVELKHEKARDEFSPARARENQKPRHINEVHARSDPHTAP